MSFRRILLALILCFILILTFILLILKPALSREGVPQDGRVSATQTNLAIPSFTAIPSSTAIPTPTPTPVVYTATPTRTPREPIFHTVAPNETLGEIAALYGMDVSELARANIIADPNLIFAGQVLLIKNPNTITDPAFTSPPQPDVLIGKQIITVLHQQKSYAFEDGVLLKEFLISSGIAAYPTVIGYYDIRTKFEVTRMTGPGYDIPDVKWVMYFHQGYGFHGTDWHNSFGRPMSHGCINMKVDEAKWLFDWAPTGTSVLILP